VRIANDGLVYVARANDRIQVFDKQGPLQDGSVSSATLANGSVWDMMLSQDAPQRYLRRRRCQWPRLYPAPRRRQVVGTFGRTGHMAGEFKWIHNLAIDAQGNLYDRRSRFRTARAEVRAGVRRLTVARQGTTVL
jgi:hypothetical protein